MKFELTKDYQHHQGMWVRETISQEQAQLWYVVSCTKHAGIEGFVRTMIAPQSVECCVCVCECVCLCDVMWWCGGSDSDSGTFSGSHGGGSGGSGGVDGVYVV